MIAASDSETALRPLERRCPVCQFEPHNSYLRKVDLTLVRCGRCGMIYASPVPARLVSGYFYRQTAVPYYLAETKREGDYAAVRFERELKLLRAFCLRGSVLDVGCSTGGFLFQLKQRFGGTYQGLGMDLARDALACAESKGVMVRHGDFLEEDFQGQNFDAVTFWAVLEHLMEPGAFLRKAAQVLRSGGFCFVLVPNMKSLAVRILGGRYRYILPQHVNYFTKKTLALLGERSFRIAKIKSTHFNPLVIVQDLRRREGFVPDAERAQLLEKTNAYKANPLLWPLKLVYRGCESVLGHIGLADNLVAVLQKTTRS